MISKKIAGRADGKSSALDALKYGAGQKIDRNTGKFLDKSYRTRLGGFGLVENGVYFNQNTAVMLELIDLAALEMQTNCDLNARVGIDKRLAHFVVSFNQDEPSEAALRDTEDSILAAMSLDNNHFATFLHNNGHWHLHIFASRIEKEAPHRGNSLWHDKIKRDKVCREIEVRHSLQRDNGLHKVDERGEIVEISHVERRARRDAKLAEVSDRAKTTEIHSGEKSFQSWCLEFRIGDRLKHAKNWQDLHAAAAAYNCEVKPKGAGFIICPLLEKGGIQLSKVGLKNLPAKFGEFEFAKPCHQALPEAIYKPEPTNKKATSHYHKWREARDAFNAIKKVRFNEQREAHKQTRKDQRAQQRSELEKIRSRTNGHERVVAVSVAKMEHSISLSALADRLTHERQSLRKQIIEQGPGGTFRDYLVKEAAKGDDAALVLAQKYGADEANEVSRKREAEQLKNVAAVYGAEYRHALRINFTHHVERNGTVIYNLGQGRTITDSTISKQVQLNDVSANNPEAIATALLFASSKFGPALTLTGSQEFQLLAVQTAVRKGLFIKFADPALEKFRKEFSENTFNSHTRKDNQHVERTQKYSDQRKPPPHRRDRLHLLSEFNLVPESSGHKMLLQGDVLGGLAKRDGVGLQGQYTGVRRAAHDRSGAERNATNQPSSTSQSTNPRVATSFGIQPVVTGHDSSKSRGGPTLHSNRRVTAEMVTQQDRRTAEQQEIIRSDSTNVHSTKFKTETDKKPLPENLKLRRAVAKKISKVER